MIESKEWHEKIIKFGKKTNHPGIDFKPVATNSKIYSIRVGIGWRACGIKDKDTMIWFWIGSHEEYNKLIKNYEYV